MDRALRILVAEDDENDAAILRHGLERAGLGACTIFVRDGLEAIEYLEEQPPFDYPKLHPRPNLLLLDLNMPRMDGFEMLEWLNGKPEWKDMLVVVFSSSDQSTDLRRASALGAMFYIVKPHDMLELMHVIERIQSFWKDAPQRTLSLA